MDTFAAIADERRLLADLLTGLTAQQRATPSLCAGWTVHDVAAHLVVPLQVSTARFALAMLACRGDFDRANTWLTREQARRTADELAGVLRARAGSRFTPPGAGPEAPLTDLVVHGLDIRRPLGIERAVPADRLRAALGFLTSRAARGIVRRGVLDGLRLEASDVGWEHGDGPAVRGDAETLLLAITGRPSGPGTLEGDGLATLRERLPATADR